MSKSTTSSSNREIRRKSIRVDRDDSTDDEKVTTGVRDYDLSESLRQFERKSDIRNRKYGNPESLRIPFALHAFGRGIYFSEPVGEIYEAPGGLKENHLGSKEKIRRGDPRKTLPESNRRFPMEREHFEDEIDFISNKRLADRSLKRHGRNKHEEASASKLSQKIDWAFADGSAKKEMGITPNNKVYYSGKYPGYRDDWVDSENQSRPPYLSKAGEESVVKIANDLKTEEELTDQQVATHVRQVFKGDQSGLSEEGKKKLVFLTSLLFGPETSRNPACYVTHQMFLDLIEGEHPGFETWEGALGANKLPMMIGGAIAASRKINDLMNDDGLMPVVYHYDYNIGHHSNYKGYRSESPSEQSSRDARAILKNEVSIASDWLRLNDKSETFESLAIFLPEKIKEWYKGVDLSHFSSSVTIAQSEAKGEVSTNLDTESRNAEVEQDLSQAMQDLNITQKTKAKGNASGNSGEGGVDLLHFSPQEGLTVDSEAQAIDFNQRQELLDQNDLTRCYDSALKKDIGELRVAYQSKSERCLTDDERFVCLRIECANTPNLSFNLRADKGYAEIKKEDKVLAISPIQSISTDHANVKDNIEGFIENLGSNCQGTKIIFSIHGNNHYKTLAIDLNTNKYRYIDPMLNRDERDSDQDALKAILGSMSYTDIGTSYQKQQYSEDMSTQSKGVISHNNECAFHSVYTTIRIAQSRGIGSILGNMNRYEMKMVGAEQNTLTPEYARDTIRPVYEEVFRQLKEIISERLLPNNSVSAGAAENAALSRSEQEVPRQTTTPPRSPQNSSVSTFSREGVLVEVGAGEEQGHGEKKHGQSEPRGRG